MLSQHPQAESHDTCFLTICSVGFRGNSEIVFAILGMKNQFFFALFKSLFNSRKLRDVLNLLSFLKILKFDDFDFLKACGS